MIAFGLAFLSSMGALLFEFSLGQFIAMNLGSSAFGYAFVVGTFLMAMGVGAWLSEKSFVKSLEPDQALIRIETVLALVSLITLPLLSFLIGLGVRLGPETGAWIGGCRSLLCESKGLSLLGFGVIFLFLMGAGVGMEVPLYHRLFQERLSRILSGDYIGAFVAGFIFPLLLLPRMGLIGTLIVGAALHAFVVAVLISHRSLQKWRWVGLLLGLLIGFSAFYSQKIEATLLNWMTRNPFASKSEVLFYKQTQRQSVMLVQNEFADGQKDQRLFLDGFLQFSSLGSKRPYHSGMLISRRERSSASQKILILGGGDGVLAEAILTDHPDDEIQIVDYDCEMMEYFSRDPNLRSLSPRTWKSEKVHLECADAFWFVGSDLLRQRRWDFVYVDFPHTHSDAAAAKVETFDFFVSLHKLLYLGGHLVVHHESFGSGAQKCVEKNLEFAGFQVRVQEAMGMAILDGEKQKENLMGSPSSEVSISGLSGVGDRSWLQSVFRQPCYAMLD